ncbi:QacE family quaternary ammonium compound efflux SMR transporter [Streptomyces griseoluteus]|uniref:QacE family quaternary ammonium compound efflux SMR transporter n=1 Tax=Streptomyces griseoluteus TaxID=29306 RepID=A0A4Z1D6L7_STRGP|nr:SMR family transporter [Streptomyces griseoluteus]TGN77064.1 QacE family quaternary ammonium compound efflux SMR transporter [Streptomyces griseoluteus]
MTWAFLAGAILSEVAGTLCLGMASRGRGRRWLAATVTGYLTAFAFLTLALSGGMALGVAYGIWAAAGVALTAVAARALFGEPLTRVMGAGICLIAVGVLCIELGAGH